MFHHSLTFTVNHLHRKLPFIKLWKQDVGGNDENGRDEIVHKLMEKMKSLSHEE